MADNTQVNSGAGDVIRDIDRGAGVKTQINQIDMGGDATNAEALLSKFAPMPVADVSQIEGLSNAEMLGQLLLEARITNELLYALISNKRKFISPGEFRDHPHYFD